MRKLVKGCLIGVCEIVDVLFGQRVEGGSEVAEATTNPTTPSKAQPSLFGNPSVSARVKEDILRRGQKVIILDEAEEQIDDLRFCSPNCTQLSTFQQLRRMRNLDSLTEL
jgi:hypothetical protein